MRLLRGIVKILVIITFVLNRYVETAATGIVVGEKPLSSPPTDKERLSLSSSTSGRQSRTSLASTHVQTVEHMTEGRLEQKSYIPKNLIFYLFLHKSKGRIKRIYK